VFFNLKERKMKKLLLSALFLLLLPCFVFGATVPAALKTKPVQVKEVNVNTKKIKPDQIKKRPENAAIKIMSITFQTTSTGNWGVFYEVINPGLVNFAAHQLKYTAFQTLKIGNTNPVPIFQMTDRRGHPHGVKRSYHSPLNRCSLASTMELRISYKGKILDRMTVKVPPMNVKISKIYALNGRYTAHLKNNTNYVAKVTLRTIARVGFTSSSSFATAGDSTKDYVLGPQTTVLIPANSTKACTDTIVKHGKNPSLQVIFKDERTCIGKGYIILASKTLTPPSKSDLIRHLTPKKASDKAKADIPAGIKDGSVKLQFPFKIVDESFYNYMGVNNTFTVDFTFSADVDPGTMRDSVVEFYIRSYENNHYVDEQRLYGKWENTAGKVHLRWTTTPLTGSFQMVDYGVNNNYLQISVSVHSTIKSDKGVLLDGDGDGTPGGWPYKHKFYIGK
jgi:hypothetical protein